MANLPKVGLDNPLLRNRLRSRAHPIIYDRPHAYHPRDGISDIRKGKSGTIVLSQVTTPTPPISTNPAAPSPPVVVLQEPPTIKKRPDQPKQTRSSVLKRQIAKPSPKKYRSLKHRRSWASTILMTMAALIFITGSVVAVNMVRTNKTAKTQVTKLSNEAEKSNVLGIADEAPTETPAQNDLSNYKVPAESPRILTIKKMNVIAKVQPVGITSENTLKSPANIFDAGWYQGSAKPGEAGAVVIDGHVSGPTKSGLFYSIGSLKAGDKIELERGDGKLFNYTVVTTKLYDNDKVDMTKIVTAITPNRPGLNLITSSGRFNILTNQYEQRIAIFATQD